MATVHLQPYISAKQLPTPSSKWTVHHTANAMHLEECFNGFVSSVQTRHTVSEKGIKTG
jgi:hypothetical protein